jgi:glutamine phosphoribosylpyrophosphate amidotransferase
MCAVIGIQLRDPSREDFETIKKVFIESKIRGLHATGISYLIDQTIFTLKEPIPADQFIANHFVKMEKFVDTDGVLSLIGHCRYSTSDLTYNQPIGHDYKAIVHNGVITQELPENWKELFGYDCVTKNDSELLLHSEQRMDEFFNSSISAIELYAHGEMVAYRNGKRPLHFCPRDNGVIVVSTADIAKRSGLDALQYDRSVYHNYFNGTLKESFFGTHLSKELQPNYV